MNSCDNSLVTTQLKWVTADKCAELVGLSVNALNAMRSKGEIRLDVHWTKRNGRIFINLAALQQWVEGRA